MYPFFIHISLENLPPRTSLPLETELTVIRPHDSDMSEKQKFHGL